MHVTLFTSTGSYSTDLPVSVRWTGGGANEFGSASLFVPRTSAAFAYVNQDGRQLLTVADPVLGSWRGITSEPEVGEEGATLPAIHIAAILSHRIVSRQRQFKGVTAGAIARAGAMDAVAGLGGLGLRLGTFLEAAPAIDYYEFRGQTYAQVLADMMDITGQEWRLDNDDGAISWIPRTGSLYASVLCEGADIISPRRRASGISAVAEAIAADNLRRESRAISPDPSPWWPAQEFVTAGNTPGIAARSAQSIVALKGKPYVSYSFKLKYTSTAASVVRVGDIVQLLTPNAGVTATAPLIRITGLSYADGQPDIDVTSQYIPPVESTTVFRAFAEAAPSAPPPPPTKTDDTPQSISILKEQVLELQQRAAAVEQVTKSPTAAPLLAENLVTAWNTQTGFNAAKLTGSATGLTAVTASGQVRAGTIGVGNSASATTPGTVQKKIEIFDASGSSLGFIAVYDAIT